MAKKLYVGNLGPKADEATLRALFSMFGTVEKAYIIPDKQTGQSKGYGFVIMSSEAEAEAAIKALDGKKCGDYTVKVEEAKGKGLNKLR
jgi:RNA recognition motif-containing protein